MKIRNVKSDIYDDVLRFLETVPGIKINKEVVENASLLIEDDKIVGIISFEVFNSKALIRYFIFKKIIDEKIMSSLFENLLKNARAKNIKRMLAFISNEETIPIFEFLGFETANIEHVCIEKKHIYTIIKLY